MKLINGRIHDHIENKDRLIKMANELKLKREFFKNEEIVRSLVWHSVLLCLFYFAFGFFIGKFTGDINLLFLTGIFVLSIGVFLGRWLK